MKQASFSSCLDCFVFHSFCLFDCNSEMFIYSGCLNWWCSQSPGPARRLIPLATSGDGNCLLHAASLAMWGIHDRLLTLRQALQETLTDSPMAGSLRRRWTYDIEQRNKEAGGLVYSQMEWDREWNDVLRLSSCQERPSDSLQPHYESLEEIHVFALAHVLHRPLIVISDKYLRDCDNVPIAPIYFGGVYLPLERHPTKCSKTPLLLTYEASHFSALVSVESHAVEMMEPKKGLFPKRNRKKNPSAVVPLQLADGSLLPVHFSIDRENLKELASIKKTYSHLKSLDEMIQDDLETYHLKLMKKYLDVSEFDLTFVHEEQPGPPLSPVSLSADCKSVCSSEGSSVPLQGQHLQNSTVKANKRSFFSALAAGFRFGNNKLKLPPDTRALGSRLDVNKRPPHYDDLIANYLESAHDRFLQAQKKESQKERERESSRRQQEEEKAACETRHCQTVGCEMYGTAQTDFLCSHCYAQQLQHLGKTYQHPILIGTGSNHPTGLVRRDTSGLGGHYDFNQSSPSWTELASHPSVSRNKLLDLNQYAGYYPDSVQTATCDFPAHRSSISYPHTRSQIGFTDAGKQLETQYLNRTHRGRDRVSISQDDQCTHV